MSGSSVRAWLLPLARARVFVLGGGSAAVLVLWLLTLRASPVGAITLQLDSLSSSREVAALQWWVQLLRSKIWKEVRVSSQVGVISSSPVGDRCACRKLMTRTRLMTVDPEPETAESLTVERHPLRAIGHFGHLLMCARLGERRLLAPDLRDAAATGACFGRPAECGDSSRFFSVARERHFITIPSRLTVVLSKPRHHNLVAIAGRRRTSGRSAHGPQYPTSRCAHHHSSRRRETWCVVLGNCSKMSCTVSMTSLSAGNLRWFPASGVTTYFGAEVETMYLSQFFCGSRQALGVPLQDSVAVRHECLSRSLPRA